MTSGSKPHIVSGMDNTKEYDQCQEKKISRFREVLPQVLATMACNMVALDVIITLAFSTVAIAQLHHAEGELSLDNVQASWIASIPYICQPVGSVVSGMLVQVLGRKRSLMLVNIPFLVGWILVCTANSFVQLALAQVILGITIGLCEAPLNTYYGEISQPELRGILAGTAGMSYQSGFFLEYLLGTITHWRTVAMINAAFPVITVIYFSQVPEAPIWLLSKGRTRDAEKALCWLRGWVRPSNVREEFSQLVRYNEEAKKQSVLRNGPTPRDVEEPDSHSLLDRCPTKPSSVESQSNAITRTPAKESCWKALKCLRTARDLLRPPTLRPLCLVIPFFFFVHWSGMTAIRPYMVHVFEGFRVPIDAKWATVVSAGTGIIGNLCLLFLIQSTGKRFLSLCGTAMCFAVCILLGVYAYTMPEDVTSSARWIPLVLFIFLSFAQSIVSQIPWTLLCEVFPYRTRGLASGITAAGCYVFLFLASKTYLDIEHGMMLYGAFWFYGTVSFVGFFFLYFRMVETEGKTLEEIEQNYTQGLSARKT